MAENNMLPGSYEGTWTASGNDRSESAELVTLEGVPEAPTVDDAGNLVIPIHAGDRVTMRIGGDRTMFDRGFVGPIVNGTYYSGRVALVPSVDLEALRLEAHSSISGQWGAETRLRSSAGYGYAAAGEVFDQHAGLEGSAATYSSSTGDSQGMLALLFTPTADGTVTVAPAWYGDRDDMPAALDLELPSEPEPEPEPEPEEPPAMEETNLLPGTYTGQWEDTGNDHSSTAAAVRYEGVAAPATVDDNGNLVVTVTAGDAVTIHLGGAAGSAQWGYVGPQESGAYYAARVRLHADTDLEALTIEAYAAGADGWGQPQSQRVGTGEYGDLEAGTVFDDTSNLDGNAASRSRDTGPYLGKAVVMFTPTDDGTVTLFPAWYGYTEDVPATLEPGEDDDEDEDEDDDDPVPDDELVAELAQRVAAYSGKAGKSRTVEIATAQVPVVLEFVRGYTRGHGFNDNGTPEAALRAVIVAACARLTNNPQQVRQFSVADYSETPALLQGFTIIERMTLNRYRKVWA